MQEDLVLPTHLGFILDGNRRWAKKHSLPEYDGHLAGYNALKDVIDACFDYGIAYVSIYAFSTENWKRDKSEVSSLMKLVMHAFSKDLKHFIKRGIRIRILGRRDMISAKVLGVVEKAEEATQLLNGGQMVVCFDYGGQQEIVDAARACVRDGLQADQITDTEITKRLYGPDIPPVDMVVRTSGEQRISNFMLWRIAYSEFLFLDKLWPEMTKDDVTSIIEVYGQRSRRFGG